jgi:hypothetical protein
MVFGGLEGFGKVWLGFGGFGGFGRVVGGFGAMNSFIRQRAAKVARAGRAHRAAELQPPSGSSRGRLWR